MMQIYWPDFTLNATALYITISLVLLSAIYYYFKNRDIPPGPIGLPYFGYWPFLGDTTCHLQLHELGKKYGDVFSFTATGQLYISVGSFKSNREAFVSKIDCFSERIKGYTLMNRIYRGSILTAEGEEWEVFRKFLTQQFKEQGITNIKGHGCGPMYDAIQDTIEDLRNSRGSPICIDDFLVAKCTKILFDTCFGEGSITEQETKHLIEIYENIITNLSGPSFLPCGTFAKYFIFPFMKSFRNMLKSLTTMEHVLHKIVDRNKEAFNEHNIRNFFDAYQKEKLEKLSKNDPEAQYFTDFNLVGTLIEFIGDGVFLVVGFIGTVLFHLLQYPEHQDKIYEELMEVVGAERDPSIEDKSKLSYTNAFLSEIMRISEISPFFPKLQCTKEVVIRGYRIPRGANMLVNMWNAHHDPDVYEDPEKFDPTRFLPQDGKKKPETPLLFGIGKHSCLGENFTVVQAFLFMATILKHFRLQAPKHVKNTPFYSGKLLICAQSRKE